MTVSRAVWTALAGLWAGSAAHEAATADYSGLWRPQVHFSPPTGFMNDPNGMFRAADGTWHLYYQYNPTGLVAGNQHWGHATNPDLYHWTNQGIALSPLNASSLIFSGSAVVDADNTSGFFPDQRDGVVAIYTVATYAPVELQTQFIAYSRDGGYTFTPYARNPVLDVGSSQFRDPQVTWHGDHWVMAVAYAVDFTVGFFTSPDLKTWTHASNFSHHGLLGLQYECPNLVEVPVEGSDETVFLLQVSINPGAPQGGSFTQYFLGDFDGYSFRPRDAATRIDGFGKDAYAGQFFSGLPRGEAVAMHWASNWQYTNEVPTGPAEGWRSAMGVPRRVAVKALERVGLVEVVRPADLTPVLGDVLLEQTVGGNATLHADYAHVASNAVHLALRITHMPASMAGRVAFAFVSEATGERLETVVQLGGDAAVAVNRGKTAGFDSVFFTDKVSQAQLLGDEWCLEAIADRSVYETFMDYGASTTSFFPTAALTRFELQAEGLPAGVRVEVVLTGLTSGWA